MRISDWSSDVCSSDLEPITLEDFVIRVKGQAVDLDGDLGIGEQDIDLPPAEATIGPPAGDAGLSQQAAEYPLGFEIGKASCWERVCKYVKISVVAGAIKKTNN